MAGTKVDIATGVGCVFAIEFYIVENHSNATDDMDAGVTYSYGSDGKFSMSRHYGDAFGYHVCRDQLTLMMGPNSNRRDVLVPWELAVVGANSDVELTDATETMISRMFEIFDEASGAGGVVSVIPAQPNLCGTCHDDFGDGTNCSYCGATRVERLTPGDPVNGDESEKCMNCGADLPESNTSGVCPPGCS